MGAPRPESGSGGLVDLALLQDCRRAALSKCDRLEERLAALDPRCEPHCKLLTRRARQGTLCLARACSMPKPRTTPSCSFSSHLHPPQPARCAGVARCTRSRRSGTARFAGEGWAATMYGAPLPSGLGRARSCAPCPAWPRFCGAAWARTTSSCSWAWSSHGLGVRFVCAASRYQCARGRHVVVVTLRDGSDAHSHTGDRHAALLQRPRRACTPTGRTSFASRRGRRARIAMQRVVTTNRCYLHTASMCFFRWWTSHRPLVLLSSIQARTLSAQVIFIASATRHRM